MMHVGIAADHGGFALKELVAESLRGIVRVAFPVRRP